MLLDVSDVSFTYPGSSVEAVSGLSFHLPETGVIGLVGMNGSGKSTLLSLISGARTPTAGEISFAGARPTERVSLLNTMPLRGNEDLPEFLTGSELLRLYASLYGVDVDEEVARRLAARYQLEGKMGSLLEDLSHGAKKKVQFLCALLLRRRLTILDETLNGVDFQSVARAKEDLRALGREGLVVVCTHDQFLVQDLVSRFLVLDRGALRLDVVAAEVEREYGSLTKMMSQLIYRK